VSKFIIIMWPDGTDFYRHIDIAKKHLPQKRDRMWAAVVDAGQGVDEMLKGLAGKEYDTKTRGHRHQPAARPAGEGTYELVSRDERATCVDSSS
jgi:hypothetical protein